MPRDIRRVPKSTLDHDEKIGNRPENPTESVSPVVPKPDVHDNVYRTPTSTPPNDIPSRSERRAGEIKMETPTLKRSLPFVDLTGSDGEEKAPKRLKSDARDSQLDSSQSQSENIDELPESAKDQAVQLTSAQEVVVKLALKGHNIFLTGAAGSDETVTLTEIIRRLQSRFKTKSGDLPKRPIADLLKLVKPTTEKAILELKVLIIEEVSMVENQFLERLDCLLRHVLENTNPFGGIQVILVGEFHQLPPVKPFEFCLECGEPMTKQSEYTCTTRSCQLLPEILIKFKEGDMWAFKAPVWEKHELRQVKLEQIHRQKDGRFQDILNKIRNGVALTDAEWHDLERKKQLPRGNFANAYDTCIKRGSNNDDKYPPRSYEIARKLVEHRESLKDHRFQTKLTLKVGSKVVLLSNLNPKGGLVNGSQGEVVGFVNTEGWPEMKEQSEWQTVCFNRFNGMNDFWRPLVRFAGRTHTIPPVTSDSSKGPSWESRFSTASALNTFSP
ncbi:hypothetical protein G7Y89_g1941 [Cudoniella acicularis]|uniref:ATP-dependent DNA helicase n=1 Tax=Cudoniella acicularis TaxID=354080 RepID=A0A8H4W933_9HELO|nr:hypothetical protein G7Y89_g1941 [Cudoniella acicularis]